MAGRQYKMELLLIGLFALTIPLIWRAKGIEGGTGQSVIHDLPTRLGEWQSKEQELSDNVLLTLGARDYLLREYSLGEAKLAVYITYFDTGSGALTHNPEKCYTGAGWTFLDKRTVALKETGQEVLFAMLARGESRQATMYWYQRGDRVMVSKWAHIGGIVWRALAGRPTNSLVVSVSASADGTIADVTFDNLAKLSCEVMKALMANMARQ